MAKEQLKRTILTPVVKRTTGVYQIRCSDGRLYIGSSVDIRSRWSQHLQKLQRDSHSNWRLQQAWNKVNTTFEFSVLEVTDRDQLFAVEQKWIEETRCTDLELGFNIFDIAGSPGGRFSQTWEGFVDPHGNSVTIHNLFAFCREHQLDFASMHRLSVGVSKLKSYKGWTHRNSMRKRDYVKTHTGFIDPQGNRADAIVNLADFCREHGLDDTHMLAVAHGRICSHRGWTHINGRQRQDVKTYHGFVNLAGDHIHITNLRSFCRDHGLQYAKMHEVKSGKIRQHKGWTWKEEQNDGTYEP